MQEYAVVSIQLFSSSVAISTVSVAITAVVATTC